MIIRWKGKYRVVSEKTGRHLGSYKSYREAKRRLRQIEYFKKLKKKNDL